jgi:hypothetical protein
MQNTDSTGAPGNSIITSSFGWEESARPVETCPTTGCASGGTRPTDLYCASDGRFLPLSREWSDGVRSTAIGVFAALVYLGFALTAELDSWLPTFFVLGAIGLSVVALPLRNFPVTAKVAGVFWITATVIALIYHAVGARSDAVTVAVLLIAGGCGLAAHSGFFAIFVALGDDGKRPRQAIALVAAALVVAAAAGTTFLAFELVPMPFPLDEGLIKSIALYTAGVAVAFGVVVALAVGMVDGPRGRSPRVPEIEEWAGFRPVGWQGTRKPVLHRPSSGIDVIYELIARAAIRVRNAVVVVAWMLARKSVNFVLGTARVVVNSLIYAANVAINLCYLIVWVAWLALGATVSILFGAAELAVWYVFYALVVLVLPVSALAVAAATLPWLAEETRRYLLDGSLAVLAEFVLLSVMAITALTAAWILLANQRLNVSVSSVRHSAGNVSPYVLLLVTAGGWLVGLPGSLGYGRVHLGWVTFLSTALLVTLLIWSRLDHRHEPKPGSALP